MRFFYQYRFPCGKMKDCGSSNAFEIAERLIKALDLSYKNCFFRVTDIGCNSARMKKLLAKYPNLERFSASEKEIARHMGETFTLNELSNCLSGSRNPSGAEITESDIESFRYIFTRDFEICFCFNEIPWFGEYKPVLFRREGERFPFLHTFCSGIIVEKFQSAQTILVCFEADEKNNDFSGYISRIEKELGCKALNFFSYRYFLPEERQNAEAVFKKQRKTIKALNKTFNNYKEIKSIFQKDGTAISISAAIRKIIKGTDFVFERAFGGVYDVNLIDRNNNQLKISFDYVHNTLYAGINYCGAAFNLAHAFGKNEFVQIRPHFIREVRSYAEAEKFIADIFASVNKNLPLFDRIGQSFPLSPKWLKYD